MSKPQKPERPALAHPALTARASGLRLLLLEAGDIPFHKLGRHRRIRVADLRAYKELIDNYGRDAADTLTSEAQGLGLGYWMANFKVV